MNINLQIINTKMSRYDTSNTSLSRGAQSSLKSVFLGLPFTLICSLLELFKVSYFIFSFFFLKPVAMDVLFCSLEWVSLLALLTSLRHSAGPSRLLFHSLFLNQFQAHVEFLEWFQHHEVTVTPLAQHLWTAFITSRFAWTFHILLPMEPFIICLNSSHNVFFVEICIK